MPSNDRGDVVDGSAMSRSLTNLRLFVAVYPPPDVARALLDALSGLEVPPYRLVPQEQVHLTLHFVGDQPAAKLESTIESVKRAGTGLCGFDLKPDRLISLPTRGRARLIAAETDGPPPLLEVKRRLARSLSQAPRVDPGDRFLPHLTLCRFGSPASIPLVEEVITVAPFPVTEIVLMKSNLTPSGAQHHEVAAVELGS